MGMHFRGGVMRGRRSQDEPLADDPRVTSYDLLELREMDDLGWSLGVVLAGNPGWAGRGMEEATA